MNTKIIANPKDSDFQIFGQLIKIEVHHTSFSVFSQTIDHIELSFDIQERIYPITELRRFFMHNAKSKWNYLLRARQINTVLDHNG